MKKVLFTLCLGFIGGGCFGQNFMHALYDYTPNRVNPALASSDNYQKGLFIFRNQYASKDIKFMTSYAEGNHPIFNEERRWSGVSVSLLNDRNYGAQIYSLNQISASYAINVPLQKYSEFSIGLNSSFQSKSLNTQGLTTGSQYVEYFGFDPDLPSGEGLGTINKNYFSFAFGLSWQKLDRYGKTLFSAGYALHNLNRPEDSFYESNVNKLPFVSILTASATLMENYQWHIKQDVFLRHAGPVTELVTGPSFRYVLGNMGTESIRSMLRYSSSNNIMLGAVYESQNFAFGGSFDFNVLKNNVSNSGTFEIMLSIKRLKRPKRKSNLRFNSSNAENEVEREIEKEDNFSTSSPVENEDKQNEKEKEEKITVKTEAGTITYLPHELEDLNYSFQFDFDDYNLNQKDEQYIKEMTEIIRQNKRVKVKLVGHTDNVGTEEYNMELAFERAKKIGIILLKNGVPKRKIKLVSRGEGQPISTNKSSEGRAKNRRVEMQLVYE
ncbi:PorP/SprF family type IX secretion system membrane protein [uncultured Marivirga sp.]|uniref:PorP/SprF family type IX secretion system membrane protein n=1 Tax=uncultured Marivirga sp. TaxID=1123707 RepID=UPI0030EB5D1E|tara:strand:- start:320544 stop:322031 length:1488 start_codon:yes stop_codon:yes gene_type:complete